MDWAEERVYVGSADGRIYQVDLLDQGKHQQQNKDQSDDDDDETEQIGTDDGERRRRKFVGHEKAVTCLSVLIDGSRLLSGTLLILFWSQQSSLMQYNIHSVFIRIGGWELPPVGRSEWSVRACAPAPRRSDKRIFLSPLPPPSAA